MPKYDFFWHFEARQALAAERDDFLLSGLPTFFQLNECAWNLAPFLVRARHDRHADHGRMAAQHVLDFHDEMFSPPEMMTSLERSLVLQPGLMSSGSAALPHFWW